MNPEGVPARGSWSEEETRLRQALCRIGALCYQRNFIVGADGNLSVRMSDGTCLLYTSPSPRDRQKSRMPSSA